MGGMLGTHIERIKSKISLEIVRKSATLNP